MPAQDPQTLKSFLLAREAVAHLEGMRLQATTQLKAVRFRDLALTLKGMGTVVSVLSGQLDVIETHLNETDTPGHPGTEHTDPGEEPTS